MQHKILIVDDFLPFRKAIRAILDLPPFQVCGEAENGNEAIEKVIELRPDIVLLDINMPVMNGVRAAREIRRISPKTKIIFLTNHDAPAFRDATQLWSHAFVAKSAAADELIPALSRLAEPVLKPPGQPEKRPRTPRVAGRRLPSHPRDNKELLNSKRPVVTSATHGGGLLMPIPTRWWSFDESMVQIDRDEPGVYELGDGTGTVVYIGSSQELRKRLAEHLREPESSCIRRNATQYRIEYTHECENRERELHKVHIATYGKPPRCNDSWRASGDRS